MILNDKISRHAAIEAVISICDSCDSLFCGECRVNYPGEMNCKKVLEALPSAQPEPHWIPCSERLPDGKEYVLVTDYGETNIGRRLEGRWWLDYCGDKMKDVTAWMPLPEPYHCGADMRQNGGAV